MRILIAGCGQLGTALGEALAARGHAVWGLRRNTETLPSTLTPIAADLADRGTLSHLPVVDCVAYTAAADSSDEAAYETAYVRGLGNLLDSPALRAEPPRRVLFTSTTAVYAQQDGEWVDEHSETRPTHFSGTVTLRAEALLSSRNSNGVSVRCGGIYGPSRIRLLRSVSDGAAIYPPGCPIYTNRVHVQDVVGAFVHLAELERPEPVYNCVDNEPADLKTVLEYLARQLGAPPPRPAAVGTSGRARRTNKRCSNRRLRQSGYVFRFPDFRDGYASLLSSCAGRDQLV